MIPPVHPDIPVVLAGFGLPPTMSVVAVEGGHVNLSYRLSTPAGPRLLQRLNPEVFADGEAVLRNGVAIGTHLERQIRGEGLPESERRVARQYPARSGAPGVCAPDGAWWRLSGWIEGAWPAHQVTTAGQAREVGVGFGRFLRWMNTDAGRPPVPAIPGFHDTLATRTRFEAAVERDAAGRAASVQVEIASLRASAALAYVLSQHRLPVRIIHADAKPGNLLLDASNGEALAVIDLDTVMPGTLLVDVGDLIRSVGCAVAEDDPAPGRDILREDLIASLLIGLAAGLAPMPLEPLERALLVTAGQVITHEQATRFLTDYLAGDRYYRTTRAGQNLDRARVQLRLLRALTDAEARLQLLAASALDAGGGAGGAVA